MPLIEVVHAPDVPEETLHRLGDALPHLVSLAVECPEEPYDHDLEPGDVELRFRQLGPYDRSGLAFVVEVRSKWFESRAVNRQERVDHLHEAIEKATGVSDFGVYLSLPVAAWSQGD
ncbi:hypothetical protein SAMN02982929_00141 [Saccharopolyspora kobensis]|uniref:Tautomerase enzyme n=1 Tax=Saccharopolyspora kobensis TaxID=146035 RepID=A0A1H5T885_9PSEU|nr:hypothetical protein [Saccharopolyspora kobensis]SEF58368.1 hypothetical protein SAMN02982929_00141 [Saccharopolyspora kobensis]SFC49587.1 hypothetical protein SAMN05216506_101891 [Saccharopolyspora kobensis]